VYSVSQKNGVTASGLRVLTGVPVGEEVVERSTLYGNATSNNILLGLCVFERTHLSK
jgi:hypothetical protein